MTGGNGLVGNAIKSYQNDFGTATEFFFPTRVDADLTDLAQTEKLFRRIKPTHVIHLAARVGGLYCNMNKPVQMYEDNILINMNVVQCCQKYKVERCICTLSTCIFPDKVQYPITGSKLHEGPPHNSNFAYAHAKRMLHVHAAAQMQQYPDGCQYVCVAPTNIYGPHDNFNLEDSHVVPALIHKAHLAAQPGGSGYLDVKGTGKAQRQFLYSKDLAHIMLELLFVKDPPQGVTIVSPEQEVSIAECAELIAKKYGIKVQYDKSCSDGQLRKTCLGMHYSYTPLDEGLHGTIQWFKENYNNARR